MQAKYMSPIVLGLGLMAYLFFLFFSRRREISRLAHQHGCKPAPSFRQFRALLGLDAFVKVQQNVNERTSLRKGVLMVRNTGHSTHSAVILGQDVLVTCDPENLKAVLATKFDDFSLGPRITAYGCLLGRGIFTADDVHWEHSRSLIRPSFTKQQVSDLERIEFHLERLMAKTPGDGTTIDLQPLFFKFTVDRATEFLFGHSLNTQISPPGSESHRFAEAFDNTQVKVQNHARLGLLQDLYKLISWDTKLKDDCKFIHAYTDRYIQEALQAGKREYNSRTQRYNMLSELVTACKDPIQLRNELLNVLLAARDTTASLLSSIFFFLARHPEVWSKLSQEVEGLHGARPDWDSLKSMNYLKAVVTETLRLQPPVANNARYARRHTVLPKGGGPDGQSPVLLPEGGVVFYSVYSMHRLTSVYGPDAEAFRPERWLATDPPLRPGWGFLPFNGGPRTCLGQQSALIEASYTTVRLLQTFGEIEPRDQQPWTENLGLVTTNIHGTKVALWTRPGAETN